MKYELAYKTVVEAKNREASLLFQRVNFFLIGTAFLITGFATLTSNWNCESSCRILTLAYIINVAGLYLSIFFIIINFLNTRILRGIGDYLVDLENSFDENKEVPMTPSIRIKEIVELSVSEIYGICKFRKAFWDELCAIVRSPTDVSRKTLAPHTWIVPLGLAVFWTVVFFLVLPFCWIAVAVVFGFLGCVIPISKLFCRLSTIKCRMKKTGNTS